MTKQFTITHPAIAYEALKGFVTRRQEHFIVLTLRTNHEVIRRHVVTKGLLNRALVHPREVFYPAIKDNAAAIIVAHNHPSGNTEPSREDVEVTARLRSAGEILGIPVLDHVIVGRRGYYSFLEAGR